MEICEGPHLAAYIKVNECLAEAEAKCIVKQLLSALAYLNRSKPKIIHYDLKPQNIMLHKGVVKIIDFGLCKVI